MMTIANIDASNPDEVEEFLKDAAVCTVALPLAMAKVIRELQAKLKPAQEEPPHGYDLSCDACAEEYRTGATSRTHDIPCRTGKKL